MVFIPVGVYLWSRFMLFLQKSLQVYRQMEGGVLFRRFCWFWNSREIFCSLILNKWTPIWLLWHTKGTHLPRRFLSVTRSALFLFFGHENAIYDLVHVHFRPLQQRLLHNTPTFHVCQLFKGKKSHSGHTSVQRGAWTTRWWSPWNRTHECLIKLKIL